MFEPSTDMPFADDDERRHRVDREPVDQVGTLLDVDLVDGERRVVAAALEHLSDEPLHASASS